MTLLDLGSHVLADSLTLGVVVTNKGASQLVTERKKKTSEDN